jgi:hypothetical protein
VQDPESAARASLARSLLVYGALFAIDATVVWYILSSGVQGGGYITLSIFVVVGMMLGYQVFEHLMDLRAPLAESEGVVLRKWKRAELIIFWDSYYVNVDRAMFRVRPEDYVHLDESMYVKVVHFPHTLGVVSIHEMRPPTTADPSALT